MVETETYRANEPKLVTAPQTISEPYCLKASNPRREPQFDTAPTRTSEPDSATASGD